MLFKRNNHEEVAAARGVSRKHLLGWLAHVYLRTGSVSTIRARSSVVENKIHMRKFYPHLS